MATNKEHGVILLLVATSMIFLYQETTNLDAWSSANLDAWSSAVSNMKLLVPQLLLTDGNTTRQQNREFEYAYMSYKAADYGWVAVSWIPPRGVPYYTGSDIHRIFRSENTLWIGDSTARQDYQTMYSVITADNPNNVGKTELNNFINKNKEAPYTGNFSMPFHCPDRQPPPSQCLRSFPCRGGLDFFEMGQVRGTDGNCFPASGDTNATTNNHATIPFETGKFDLSHALCYKDVFPVLRNATKTIRREYSVVIVSLGISDFSPDCMDGETAATDRLVKALDFFHQRVSGPSLFVIWKTHGPHADEAKSQGIDTIELISATRRWFNATKPKYMDIADVGGMLTYGNHAFGIERVSGDAKDHWGTNARTLTMQMASHIMDMKDVRDKASS